MLKKSKKAKATLAAAIFFSIVSSAITVSLSFLIAAIVDAATGESVTALVYAVMLTLGVWALDITIGLVAVRLRIGYTLEMLYLSKKNRMAFLFNRRLRTPAEDNNSDLSFFTADIDVLRDKHYRAVARFAADVSQFAFAMGAMIWISPLLTLAVAGATMFPILVTAPFGKPLNRRTKAYSETVAGYVGVTRECIMGQRDIQAYDKQEIFLARHDEANRRVEKARMRSEFLEVFANYSSGYAGFLIIIVTMGLGSYFVIQEALTFGLLIAVVQLMSNLVSPVTAVAHNVNGIRASKALLLKAAETAEPEPPKEPLAGFERAIEIKDLGLKYNGGEHVVRGVSLRFEKGRKYAILAPSGKGKTSIARALAGEFADFDGEILIDGKDIRGLDARSYNKTVRYVRQDPYLFSDTAMNNLTFFDAPPPKEEMDKALGIARVDEFMEDEEALGRQISNSSGLSGGQKQRIVLARALLHKPRVLLLDEITSGVDLESACLILADLFRDRELTVVAITHERDERFLSMFDEIVEL